MIKRDNIHYSTRKIDGYNLPFNFVISERELGKSTTIILDKIYKPFKERGETTIVIRRNVNHISEDYVEDFANIINKFTDDNVVFQYSKNSLKDGIATIKIDGKPFIRFIGLSKTIASIPDSLNNLTVLSNSPVFLVLFLPVTIMAFFPYFKTSFPISLTLPLPKIRFTGKL